MFGKLFSKEVPPATPTPPPPKPASEKMHPLVDLPEWRIKLEQARGNEPALVELALHAPVFEIKLAAVGELNSDEMLKQVERQARDNDQRVARAVRAKLSAKMARQKAQAEAAQLIEACHTLSTASLIPANRLVGLDSEWAAIEPSLISPEQQRAFATIRAQLTAQLRDRADREAMWNRWSAQVERGLLAGLQALHDVAAGHIAADILLKDYETLLQNAPEADPRNSTKREALMAAIKEVQAVNVRVRFLATLVPGLPQASATSEWAALPPVKDAAFAGALEQRFKSWGESVIPIRAPKRLPQDKCDSEARQAWHSELKSQIEQAERALTDGRINEAARHINAIQAQQKEIKIEGVLHRRIEAVQHEVSRLKGWQRWGGGLHRDELVAEAETLAKEGAALNKLAVTIERLRQRWKDLDQLGAATNQTLWNRFDAALKTAYVPLAEHLEKQKAARAANLAEREKIITALNTFSETMNAQAPDWRMVVNKLTQADSDWRKLGPLEHTVPRAAQSALAETFAAALQRLQSPLDDARRVEKLKREKLIEAAREAGKNALAKDAITKIRQLQANWQSHAKAIPLTRHDENDLWSRFKAATDAVFAAHHEVHQAREAETKAQRAIREALLQRLQAITQSEAESESRRDLQDIDHAWRRAGDMPREATAQLGKRYREARENARRHIDGLAHHRWREQLKTLQAKIALCAVRETNPDVADDWETRWSAIPQLPEGWEAPIHRRFQGMAPEAAQSMPDLLLQLEAACVLPSPAAFEAARAALKMRALKAAMESRQTLTANRTDIERWLIEAAAQPHPDTQSAQRLAAIVEAIKGKPPGC